MASRDPQKNESDIFAEWMATHGGIIVKIVRGFTSDPANAEDLTQDITLAVWRSIRSFRGESKPSTWIWRIALNQAISWQRAAKDPPIVLDVALVDSVELSTADRSDAGLAVDSIYDAIRTLAPIDRSLIILALEGHSYAEIAETTGLSQSNVGARLSRARARLTEHLEMTR